MATSSYQQGSQFKYIPQTSQHEEGLAFWTNMIHLSVEGVSVVHPRALRIYLNSPSSSQGPPVQIYSTDMPASQRVFLWTIMIHMRVETLTV
jgi:hypothetical protein